MCSQGSERNNGWCLVAVSYFFPTSEVTGATGGACSRPLVVAGHSSLLFLRELWWFVPAACKYTRDNTSCLAPPLPLACTRMPGSHISQASVFLPLLASTRSASPSESPHMHREIPMVVHPSCFHPPQQGCPVSPVSQYLLPGSFSCGVLLSRPWHTAPWPLRLSPHSKSYSSPLN